MLQKKMLLTILLIFLPIKTNVVVNLVQEYNPAESGIARLIIDKGLNRINNDARKNVIADIYSIDEKYANMRDMVTGHSKSKQERKKTLTGRPSLDGMNVDELYKAFATRFDFLIDNNDSTRVINGIRYALIKFNPKPNLVSKTVTDAFINRTSGRVYIDLDNYEIVRVEGGISNHFITTWRAWWSPISFDIDVYQFSFSIDYTMFNNMIIEKSLIGIVDYEIRNRSAEKHAYTLSNYRIK